ncbi:hypothetical protein [Nonomuraea angiospora]|uniref:hypothetical protein n=1 Tax=Nonomuraea angiospora TaxID=46172 RepID=UPI0029BD51DA|nr:hypothetical protein [Nonomuraea angiospora]MDX3104764.1 hypothetical protein [Nonomuraea angiospora]
MRLDQIPSLHDAPHEVAPSRVRSAIALTPTARRTVLKGLFVAISTAALVPFEWALSRRAANAVGPTSEWTATNCRDGYPNGYGEQANNWWTGGYSTCFGGWRRGSYPCNSNQRHFEGFRSYSDEGYTSNRVTTCSGRNAWRWTAGGSLYRCSDANTTTVWNSGERYTALTIAKCAL